MSATPAGEGRRDSGEIPVEPPAQPAAPRPAATLVLLRHGGHYAERDLQVLMVRRGPDQSFMPGVWVFPGGVVEPGEQPAASAARELAEETSIELAEDAELREWSRWVTPEVVPVRFDTHFFVAIAPAHASAEPDGHEVDDAGWIEPAEALERNRRGELELVLPTVKTLETLLPFAGAGEVLEAARARVVEPILPRVVGTRSDHRILLPGDPGYEG